VRFSSSTGRSVSQNFRWRIAKGKHLFPFRTEQLSLSAPMVLGGKPPGRVGRRRFFLSGPRRQLARAAARQQRRATPPSAGLRSAATRRRLPAADRLLLSSLATATIVGADRGIRLLQARCTGICDESHALEAEMRGPRNPGEFSQRPLGRTRRGLRSRSAGLRRRSAVVFSLNRT
jgi:hypothetical protein